ncbi:PepSY domain-containing protein [Novispirillum sp. DQ9]|uniref:PepSY domain-containing protein n=1 Tax=Novispirillum sp. DQ9 TaxID=3398612 RepID=UPI003C7B752A
MPRLSPSRLSPSLLWSLAAVLALLAGPAAAGPDRDDHERARAALQAGEVKPLREVMEVATDQFAGEMVEAELDRKGPFWIYHITLLAPDGSILKLSYDAATTALVRARGHEVEQWFKGDPADFPDMEAARSAMHERMHTQWHQRWHGSEGGGPGAWFRRWWRGDEAPSDEQGGDR